MVVQQRRCCAGSDLPQPPQAKSLAVVLMTILCSGLLLFGMRAEAGLQDLRVNEFMASNHVTLFDEYGDADDWLEVFNTGATAVNMEGLFLTDEVDNTQMWEFPDTILPAGGYLLIWCDTELGEGPLHTNFHLDADGEFIGLYEYLAIGNDPIDTTSFGHQARDVSYGRYPNGTGPYGFMPQPTPRAANAPHGNVVPFFEDTSHSPAVPGDGEPVVVTTTISDDHAVIAARVYYDAGSGYTYVALVDDGLHGDGPAGDGTYGGTIPGEPLGTDVAYYAWAIDDSLTVGTDPETAPLETYGYHVGYVPPAIYVNEFMASNHVTIADNYGEYDDWVEVYNGSGASLNLLGFHLSDTPDEPDRFTFPDTTLPDGGFILIWCDDDAEQGPLHTTFKLDAAGEFVGLYDRLENGLVVIDTLSFGPQTTDISYGRRRDGELPWMLFPVPTPGISNNGTAVEEWEYLPSGFTLLGATSPVIHLGRVDFDLVQAGHVTLGLFDATGRRVAGRSADLPAGRVQLSYQTHQLPAGVYLLRLEAGGLAHTAKVVLAR